MNVYAFLKKLADHDQPIPSSFEVINTIVICKSRIQSARNLYRYSMLKQELLSYGQLPEKYVELKDEKLFKVVCEREINRVTLNRSYRSFSTKTHDKIVSFIGHKFFWLCGRKPNRERS